MSASSAMDGPSDDGLRERKVGEKCELYDGDDKPKADESQNQKTYGRTPDGTVFVVPQTLDMVSQLFSPSQPKNFSDFLVVGVLFLLILACYVLPSSHRPRVFLTVFLSWRACYNIGIGYLLHLQSHHLRLVAWAKKSRLFVDPTTGNNPHPAMYHLLKREMETKIPKDYKFEEAPIEYNTWLVFRRVVDLILMCDFVSYCLFAIACGSRPLGEGFFLTLMRWAVGCVLFGLNVWIKLDAHRVVKDYAWYWGDFFYMIDQELTFDGVFEMAPHPMYSIGYIGYYGISLMAASYRVLIISMVAHALQFTFLYWVENPHIEKTYNSPPPRRRRVEPEDGENVESFETAVSDIDGQVDPVTSQTRPSAVHNLIGFKNIDLHRVTDSSVILLQIFLLAFMFFTPTTPFFQALFIINAAIWRLWYSVGVGYILNRQSNEKIWTRHFLKYGESTEEAWRQWKGTYHMAMILCYASFFAAAWKMYSIPDDWAHSLVFLRHLVGVSLVGLQIWTAFGIYDSLGEFGWFFGDFFFDQRLKLTYSGIYRYLNNPERVMGLAGVWGAVLITGSPAILFLAILSHVLAFGFIQIVERPHMQKRYGQSLRRESGLTKSLKRSLPPRLFQWQGSVDRIVEETLDFVEDIIDSARPKIAAGVSVFVKDSTAIFKHPTRISIMRLSPDLAGFDPEDYSIMIEGTSSATTRFSGGPRHGSDFKALAFEFGAPIKVCWIAPLNHSKKDWIGLYMVADNASRQVTRVSSQRRWVATNKEQHGSIIADNGILLSDMRISSASRKDGKNKDYFSGEMNFSGDKLWWTTGVFEFRYHHDGKHNVLAISLPFKISINKFDEDDVEADGNGSTRGAVEQALLHLVRNCFDRDPDIAPSTIDESFGEKVERDEKYARRVVFAVHQMFGIELAPEVVQADGNIRNLAWRVCNARRVLRPYMSLSQGKSSPTEVKF